MRIEGKFFHIDVGVVQTGTGSRAFRFVCGQFKCAVQTLRVANQSAGMLRAKLLGEKTGLVLLVVAAGFLLTQIPNRNEVFLKILIERANMSRNFVPVSEMIDRGVEIELAQSGLSHQIDGQTATGRG